MSLTKVSYSMIDGDLPFSRILGAPGNVLDYGADPTGVADSTTAIQSAMDNHKFVYLPAGTYKTTAPLDFKSNGIRLVGDGRAATTINYTGSVTALRNPDSATVTRLFCSVENMKVQATTSGASGIVIDWKSMQFGQLLNVWIIGQGILGNIAINLEAVWTVTEATYNVIQGCYVGLTSIGLRIRDGANSNLIQANRFQVGVSTGSGIVLSGSVADYVSNNTIIANGFEFPGQVSNGVNVLQNCTNIVITGNRFESLNNGIVVGATGNKSVSADFAQNYFSSCTININNSNTSTAHAYGIRAAASISGTGSATVVETTFNLTAARNSAGNYTFSFVDALPSTGYTVQALSAQKITVITAKTTGSFTIETQNASGVATDSSILDVTVFYNR